MPYRATIAAAYNAGVKEEYNRLVENPLREAEFLLITELLDEYIAQGASVLDVGSGPGRYAEHLLKRNCKVGVVDLSAKSLKAFSDRMLGTCCRENILFNEISCATELDWVPNQTADAVLLMGPLYHLIHAEHRNSALSHCKRILKPGGLLISVFLSPFPVMCNSNSMNENLNTFQNPNLKTSLKTGMTTHACFQGYKVAQYRCWPKEAENLMTASGFETMRLRNIEGIASFYSTEKLNTIKNPDEKQNLLDALRASSEDQKLIGITHQYVYVGKSTL